MVFESVYVKMFVTESSLTVTEQSFFQNLFSVPLFFLLAISTGEPPNYATKVTFPGLLQISIVLLSCTLGLGMSYLSFALRAQVSATSFNVIGDVCKLVTVLLNTVIWDKHASSFGTLSIILCICSSALYEQAPLRECQATRLKSRSPLRLHTLLSRPEAAFCSGFSLAAPVVLILFYTMIHFKSLQETSLVSGADFGISGVSGNVFSGERVRQYSSELLKASCQHQGPVFVEDVKYNCTSWAVCTTIFKASDAVHDVCQRLSTFCLVVVADKKTPELYSVKGGCTFVHLSVQKQKRLWQHSNFAAEVPWNHFGRKNIGYLYAIANGAQSLWDFDDDNKLLKAEEPFSLLSENQTNLLTVNTNKVSLNPYPMFGSETFSWPRGFPLEDINDPSTRPLASQLIRATLKGEKSEFYRRLLMVILMWMQFIDFKESYPSALLARQRKVCF